MREQFHAIKWASLKAAVGNLACPLRGEPRAEARMVAGEEGALSVRLPWCVCFSLGNAWLLRDWGLQGVQ